MGYLLLCLGINKRKWSVNTVTTNGKQIRQLLWIDV